MKVLRRFMSVILVTSVVTLIFITTQIVVIRNETSLVSQTTNPLVPIPIRFRLVHTQSDRDFDSEESQSPLLTLFTTFKETHNSTFHRVAHAHAVANWASLRPHVRIVLFAQFPHSNLSEMARNAGWDVIQLKRWNEQGTPFLKDMYNTVFRRYNSTFYGFANGDILFDQSLIETLLEVKMRLKDVFKDNALLIGSRRNLKLSISEAMRADLSKENLAPMAAKQGKLDGWYAQDYFFLTRESSLNWSTVADVVIGRPGYDNYLVAKALLSDVNVIDATNTLLAVHLSEKGVSETGKSNPDSSFNLYLLKGLPLQNGLTIRSQFLTTADVLRRVFVVRRKPLYQYRLARLDS